MTTTRSNPVGACCVAAMGGQTLARDASLPVGERLKRLVPALFFVASLCLLGWLLNRVGWTTIGHALTGLGATVAIVIGLLGLAETVLDSLALKAAAPALSTTEVLATNGTGS